MKFIQFVFSFLYVRDWYTGAHELSRPRLALFMGAIFLCLLGLLLIAILQAPTTYDIVSR